jgi:S1-C subfamily serine protease
MSTDDNTPDNEAPTAAQQQQPQQPTVELPTAQTQAERDAAAAYAYATAAGLAAAANAPRLELPKKKRRPLVAIAIATAAVVGIGGLGTAGIALATRPSTSATSANTSQRNAFGQYNQNGSSGTGQGSTGTGNGFSPNGPSTSQGGQSFGSGSSSTVSDATASTASQKVGVVTINTVLNYTTDEQAAGTGMILSSDGLILTNNHVVEGSTSITVTVESTNKTYKAVVVGTDKKSDVAVLKLVDASGLSTVNFDSSSTVKVGDTIYSVGNAEGTGDLVTAKGSVGAINQSLTISGDSATESESLSGLIEVNSDVVSGDSGGPLFDKSGDVIGIITAASSGSATVTGYAINIASVLKIADKIEAGEASSTIVLGTPAFLGIELSSTTATTGVPVAGVFAGKPAANAGITTGSVITSVNGTKVTTATSLSAIIAAHKVGDRITVHWTDAKGASHSAVVTLAAGPAA